ncbi:MAG: DUF4198 domain-containing protein [Phenylobacterium sp.]|uniref:DUF4198 domain-containing protein n=1 Tax=Phenylobacterium sp. TaxID=1871053 RepID=UPI002715F1D7|nr:DUF4198 domain-containing protein [Phenylobacterium sp.]MDO8902494.1 DUF4198 domain-containing protein [Phenylobacterium sp.]
MKTLLRPLCAAAALTAMLAAPMAAQAHRQWMLPSMTVMSGNDPWITVDAAVSNDLFIFEHVPMRLDGLVITGPDGAAVAHQNAATGKYRTTFDLHLAKPGTYRIASVGDGVMASYKLGGEQKRWRGAPAELATAIPAGATEVKITHSQRRIETFATAGEPTTEALKPTGQGLELAPITHPNDLVAGETAQFRLLLDGQPAAGVEVAVIRGGGRYRNDPGEMSLTTAADGLLEITWPEPGMYWMEAELRGGKSPIEGAERMAVYVGTLEVLPD